MVDEPECWSWPIPPLLRDMEELVAHLLSGSEHLSSAERRTPEAARFIAHVVGPERVQFDGFHDGRCALCGRRFDLVQDHCHDTGQIRGWLCRSCNALEGKSNHPSVVNYRRRHPAAMLGFYEPYTGYGWHLGWSLMEHRASAYTRGPRPPTPWPTFAEAS